MSLHALQRDVSVLVPAADPDILRDLAVNDLVNATETLRVLPVFRSAEELRDLKRVIAELTCYVRQAECVS